MKIISKFPPEQIFIVHGLYLVRELECLFVGEELDDGLGVHHVARVDHHRPGFEEGHRWEMPGQIDQRDDDDDVGVLLGT